MTNAVTVTLKGQRKYVLTDELVSLHIENCINEIPYAEITIFTGNFRDRSYPLFDGVEAGSDWEIAVPNENSNQRDISIFTGRLYQRSAGIVDGQPVITLTLKDPAQRLMQGMATRIYHDKTDEDIVKSILGKYSGISLGESSNVLSTYEIPQAVQYQQTDWQFIQQRLLYNGLLCKLDNGKITPINVTTTSKKSADSTLKIDSGIIDFELAENGQELYESVRIRYWDQAMHTFNTVVEKFSDSIAKKVRAPEAEFIGSHISHRSQALNLLKCFNCQQILSEYKGFIKVAGDASYAPGQSLQLKDFPLKLSIETIISGVTHSIQAGVWITTLRLGELPSPLLAAKEKHLLQSAPSLLWGKVDTWQKDPKNFGRIALRVPSLGQETYWAWLSHSSAGSRQGCYFPPQPNDWVIVGFMHGDPAFGMVLNSVYNYTHDLPAPFKASAKSPAGFFWDGNSVIFDAEKQSFEIKVNDKSTVFPSEK